MNSQTKFKKGDIFFRQGDDSDRVLRIHSGELEVIRENGNVSVVLGHVREGEWLGEMGVIEERPRSATARATSDGSVEVLTAQAFLDQVSHDPALARDLILRLSIRLRKVEDRIVASAALDGETGSTASPSITLIPQTDKLRAQIGSAHIKVSSLPFVIGRVPAADEAPPPRQPDLLVKDWEPFRLSRDHFMIASRDGRLIISDLGSTLGTVVNGVPIGWDFMRDSAPLHRGENRIVAGGQGSPFEFLISVN
ncbi:MAG TPA: cyclic nucleotide-binding domain-containing protein [Fimbriimonas sp.]|nr:cyclic nucleotide-binding domain-containing protein [Fimbriimonas sp.]